MFYRNYILLNEEIKNFPSAHSDIQGHYKGKGSADMYDIPSGDIFTSIGRTHPEMIDMAKVEALAVSKNIVKDFNCFFDGLFKEMVDYNEKVSEKYFDVDWFKAQKDINVLVYTLDKEIHKLMDSEGISYDQALQFIKKEFLPGSLTKAGCKELIRIRMLESKIYNQHLKKMLETNYKILSLTEAEAKSLSKQLDKSSPEQRNAQAFIKSVLNKRSTLNQYRIKNLVYDFRPAGGGVLFLSSNSEDIRFTDNPAKMLSLLFKYDAVVSAHGNSNYGKSGNDVIKTIKNLIRSLKGKYAYYNKLDTGSWKGLITMNVSNDNIYKFAAKKAGTTIDKLTDEQFVASIKPQLMKRLKQVIFLSTSYLNKTLDNPSNATVYYKKMIDELDDIQDNTHGGDVVVAMVIKDIKTSMKKIEAYLHNITNNDPDDPKFWAIGAVSTLKKSFINNTVELVRQLRSEGFKNVILLNCNPGHHELPKDIVEDKNFTVTFGKNNVYKEAMDYVELSLLESEAKIEYLIESNEMVISNESIEDLFLEYDSICEQVLLELDGNKLKLFGKKILNIIMNIWRAIVKLFRHVYGYIKSKITGQPMKTSKPIDIACISIGGNKATIKKTRVKDYESACGFIANNTKTIKNFVDKQAAKEINDVKKITAALEGQQFK